jgi:hypothetical protein
MMDVRSRANDATQELRKFDIIGSAQGHGRPKKEKDPQQLFYDTFLEQMQQIIFLIAGIFLAVGIQLLVFVLTAILLVAGR